MTAAIAGDDTAAHVAFADAQSLPTLVEVRQEAALWAAREQALWNLLPDDQLDGTPARPSPPTSPRTASSPPSTTAALGSG